MALIPKPSDEEIDSLLNKRSRYHDQLQLQLREEAAQGDLYAQIRLHQQNQQSERKRKEPKQRTTMDTISSGFNFAAQEPMAPRISKKRYMAGARNAYKRFPPSKFGTVYLKRGQPDSVAMFGSSYGSATDAQKAARRNYGWRGAGLYGGQGAYGLRSLGRSAGGIIGKSLGNKSIGAAIGASLGGSASKYLGMGEYTANQLIAGGRSSMDVEGQHDETDTLILTDCEYVKDIYASSATQFASQTINCNPGLPGFAPNLSQIACNYTEYELLQLVFELRPVISESNVNNGNTGTAMMVFNYNPNDDPYDNKEDVMQAHGSVSARIIDHLSCGVECDISKTKNTKYFIRTGPVPVGRDHDEYDHGVLTIATNNIPTAFNNLQIFELWVYYKVALRKRKAGALRLVNQQKDWFICNGDRTFSGFQGCVTDTAQTGLMIAQQSNLGGRVTAGAAQVMTYTFPADFNGVVELRLILEGTGFTATGNFTPTTTGNVTGITDIYASGVTAGDTPQPYTVWQSGSTYGIIAHYKVRSATSNVDNSITLTGALSAGTVSQISLEVQEYTNSFWQSKTNYTPVTLNYATGIQMALP